MSSRYPRLWFKSGFQMCVFFTLPAASSRPFFWLAPALLAGEPFPEAPVRRRDKVNLEKCFPAFAEGRQEILWRTIQAATSLLYSRTASTATLRTEASARNAFGGEEIEDDEARTRRWTTEARSVKRVCSKHNSIFQKPQKRKDQTHARRNF